MPDAQPPSPERASGTVLIIDDHELVGTSLMLSLRSEGLSAHHSRGSGADDVLTTAAGLVPGLALLDLDLGRDRDGNRVDGVRLVAPLRAAGWRVVILSGSADYARIGAGLAEGAMAPLFVPPAVPVLQLVHHVHQDQFATRFGPVLAAAGRHLEGRGARRVYRDRPTVAVSPSTRQEMRRRLGFRGPIHIVPNGARPVPAQRAPRDPDPTICVVSRLVPHKRVDLLLQHLVGTAAAVPGLRVDIVGDGPELPRLQRLATTLGLARVVTFHGFQPDDVRDQLLGRAWLTTVTSEAEGWACSVIEAAGLGVPTVAVQAPGVRDSVVHGHTGWLVDDPTSLGRALAAALRQLADDAQARRIGSACKAWARCFDWDRSAALLAGALHAAAAHVAGLTRRRSARSDITTVARFPQPADWAGERSLAASLRPTDQITVQDGWVSLLLSGCDEVDTAIVLRRLGVTGAEIRLADRYDTLAGPAGLPAFVTAPEAGAA